MLTRRLFVLTFLMFSLVLSGCLFGIKRQLTADDIPLSKGSYFESYVNDNEDPVDVSFALQGPWDFSKGPADGIVKSRLISKDDAEDHKKYPMAQVVEEVLPTDFTLGFTIFNFNAKSDKALLSYGQNFDPKVGFGEPLIYEEPERLLRFPLKVGDKWTDELVIEREHPIRQTVKREVISRGQVKVPAGTFYDCFMIRITRTVESDFGGDSRTIIYTWWASGVGPVAVISSQVGEKSMVFKQADYVSRLRRYRISE